jgi:hypothetical protein
MMVSLMPKPRDVCVDCRPQTFRPPVVRVILSATLLVWVPATLFGQDFDPAVDARYHRFKREVLERFVDKHDLVCNRKGEDFIDQGDWRWRTGLSVTWFSRRSNSPFPIPLRNTCDFKAPA